MYVACWSSLRQIRDGRPRRSAGLRALTTEAGAEPVMPKKTASLTERIIGSWARGKGGVDNWAQVSSASVCFDRLEVLAHFWRRGRESCHNRQQEPLLLGDLPVAQQFSSRSFGRGTAETASWAPIGCQFFWPIAQRSGVTPVPTITHEGC